ncbi:class I SAM-dependent methyltransferase [Motilibacter deserti]|uniref:Class I SAM-dependent methyltransferase n=1 Tax=Motilibacter deserti TaxID=2714956 RepID=A0ABX0H004_9ACTN|nr:class I SAM-dependent methyltransferase [Motilibacter deserti]NHC15164.1 class I SAM-dependent methyltransferase [Motilibacter deserti]
MFYTEFLRGVHDRLRPATYLEVGVRDGRSLALSRARSVGVDPAFAIDVELDGDLALLRTTSDEYFARPEPLAPTAGRPYDLAFLDGLHLFEVVLRDFLHAEALSTPWSAVILDDVLPRNAAEAQRTPVGKAWTGDVWKLLPVLAEHRPGLTVVPVDTRPTGLLLVLGLDPGDTTLADAYSSIVEQHVMVREVPAEILARDAAVEPERVLAAPVWDVLRRLRERGATPDEGAAELADALARSFGRG